MPWLIFLVIIIRLVVVLSKKAKGGSDAAKTAPAPQQEAYTQRPYEGVRKATPQPRAVPAVQPAVRKESPFFDANSPAKPPYRPKTVSKPVQKAAPVHTPHVVAPSRGSDHYHTESSMTGFVQDSMPVKHTAPAAGSKQPEKKSSPELRFDRDALLSGFIYGEILGKPKAIR